MSTPALPAFPGNGCSPPRRGGVQRRGGSGQWPGRIPPALGIDIDQEGYIYVADWRNDRVQKFTADGHFVMQLGTSGTGEGELNRPAGVAVDQDGIIYVTDWGNNRLQVFDADGRFVLLKTGDATISRWGKEKLDSQRRDVERAQARPGPGT